MDCLSNRTIAVCTNMVAANKSSFEDCTVELITEHGTYAREHALLYTGDSQTQNRSERGYTLLSRRNDLIPNPTVTRVTEVEAEHIKSHSSLKTRPAH